MRNWKSILGRLLEPWNVLALYKLKKSQPKQWVPSVTGVISMLQTVEERSERAKLFLETYFPALVSSFANEDLLPGDAWILQISIGYKMLQILRYQWLFLDILPPPKEDFGCLHPSTPRPLPPEAQSDSSAWSLSRVGVVWWCGSSALAKWYIMWASSVWKTSLDSQLLWMWSRKSRNEARKGPWSCGRFSRIRSWTALAQLPHGSI